MKTMPRSFGKLLAGLLLLTSALGAKAETRVTPDEVSEPPKSTPSTVSEAAVPRFVEAAPKDWLAFLAFQGGFMVAEYSVLNQTPHIILFQDGRLVWRDDNIRYDAPNRSRDMWREAKISPEELKAFVTKADALKFFAIQPSPEVASKPDKDGLIHIRPVLCDAATTVLGFRRTIKIPSLLGGATTYHNQRVISEYALGAFGDEDKDNPYIQSLLSMQKMLQDLRPKESKRMEPDAIRVTFFGGPARGMAPIEEGVVIPVWPFAEKPDVENANIFSGTQAKTLIEQLAKSPHVQIGEQSYVAIWSPAIAVPQNLPEKASAPDAAKPNVIQ